MIWFSYDLVSNRFFLEVNFPNELKCGYRLHLKLQVNNRRFVVISSTTTQLDSTERFTKWQVVCPVSFHRALYKHDWRVKITRHVTIITNNCKNDCKLTFGNAQAYLRRYRLISTLVSTSSPRLKGLDVLTSAVVSKSLLHNDAVYM